MRLIDADKLLQETWKVKTKDMFHMTEIVDVVSAIDIKEAPTVKAIPIEWIEKKVQEFLMNRNFRWATDFQEVIDMWKTENNIPLFDGELKITWEKENEIN